jgi:hypothetical protein
MHRLIRCVRARLGRAVTELLFVSAGKLLVRSFTRALRPLQIGAELSSTYFRLKSAASLMECGGLYRLTSGRVAMTVMWKKLCYNMSKI